MGIVLIGGSTIGVRHYQAQAATNAAVTVNAGSVLGTIPQAAFGANTAAWDGDLMDGALPGLLRNAGIHTLRFPGGSSSDNYHWQTNTQSNGGYTNPSDTFDNFMSVEQQIGGEPVITVNYGSNSNNTGGGDPNEAAAWVKYANVTKHYGIKYWEIGNEVYGNGSYGANWETDLHPQKGPAAYATNALAFISAMKAVDPSIKVGLVLTAPGNWPDGQSPDWNSTVLSTACSQMDFGIIHWYPQGPGNESDSYLLSAPSQIAHMMSQMRAEYSQYCGARASQIETLVTETNSVSSNPGKQTVGLVNGLFLADTYMSFLEGGASNVDWWDLHNGITTGSNVSPSLYGSAQFGDYGLFAFGDSSNGISEPANETPYPSYYGMQMLSHLGVAGDQMVSASSSQSLVAVHAVKQANGNLAILLINKDPGATASVSVSLSGYAPSSTAAVYTYGENSAAISTSTESGIGTSFTQTIAPYSLTTVVLSPSGSAPPAVPTATATSQTAPSSTAVTGGTPGFSQQTTASPSSVAPNGSIAINTTLTNTGAAVSSGLVDLEIYDASGKQVGQRIYNAQTLGSGQSAPYTWSWTAPATAGQYTVKVGVFGASWNPLYYWANSAASVTVASGGQPTVPTNTPVVQATATNTPVVQVQTTATNTPLPRATATNPPVIRATATSTPVAQATATSAVGASGTPTLSQQTSVWPVSAQPNGNISITMRLTNLGSALSNGVVDLEIYNAAGRQVGQRAYSAQSLSAGQSAPYTWVLAAPAQIGQYTVKVGVFGASWSPLYSWTNGAASFVVAGSRVARGGDPGSGDAQATATAVPQLFVPHAPAGAAATMISFAQQTSLGAASVAPARRMTVHTTVVNKGVALRNGIVDLEVYNAAGKRVSQKIFTAQTIGSGHAMPYSWSWTAPARIGQYTVKVGVFGTSWSPLYFWTSQAAHISVR